MKFDEKNKSKQQILDDMHEEIVSNWRHEGVAGVLNRLKHNRLFKHFIRIFIITLILLVIYIIYCAIASPPRYTEAETVKNAAALNDLIDLKAGATAPLFHQSLALLENYPEYYRKVVNNIQDIQISSGICQYTCIYYRKFNTFYRGNLFDTLMPAANFDKKTLILDPRGIGYFHTPVDFASMLVHETDHVEYLESSKLRRAALFIRCNPLLNPNISITSTLPSISHRVEIIEICAERAQIDFSKQTKTASGYGSNGLIFSLFFRSASSLFSGMFKMIKSIFGF